MGSAKNTVGKLGEGVLIHLLGEQGDDGNHPANCAEQRSHRWRRSSARRLSRIACGHHRTAIGVYPFECELAIDQNR
jgi:hypothetical protein